jgi:hypothetical protein
VYFANINQNGNVVSGSPGVTASETFPGQYFVTFPVAVTNCVPVATIGFVGGFSAKPSETGNIQVDNDQPGATLTVETYDSTGAQTSSSFHILVAC